MTALLEWAATPLWPKSALRIWTALALGGLILISVVLLIAQRRKERRFQTVKAPQKPSVADTPLREDMQQLEIANLQGLGEREEQQDAFRASPLSDYPAKGLLCILCDGMGGMAMGGEIAWRAVADVAARFPMQGAQALCGVPAMLSALSGEIYADYMGQGGATLVLTYLKENKLWFWCIGDSDLFLLRENHLYAMNRRHEYKNDLLERALTQEGPPEAAWEDPQADALSAYLGMKAPACDYTRVPYPLKAGDTLLLCSDGVSDTLSLAEISQSLALPPEACCAELERRILKKQKGTQDNYTAIIVRLNDIDGGKKHGSQSEKTDRHEQA